MALKLLSLILVGLYLLHPTQALFFGGLAPPAPAPAAPPAPACCSSAPPPPPPPTCGGCSSPCGRRKRETRLMNPSELDVEECHDSKLREVIEESLTFQLASSIRKLGERLHKIDIAHNRYVGVCTMTNQSYKYFTHSKDYCSHGNEQITCHVFRA
ncbi:hypothetical protein L596_015696 [Steinernema carpocapsae]|uniref:Ground-like domain-containing protein n=1 Tax=Steinernema carpocapsae TaxID=34508 RepID=A0A4U5NFS7_STECR|nr:hypothetical protein L596_015696 [Steinernema carpocapsae]